jgi:hypothetical protein
MLSSITAPQTGTTIFMLCRGLSNEDLAPRIHLPRLASNKQMILRLSEDSLHIKFFPTPRISVKKKLTAGLRRYMSSRPR